MMKRIILLISTVAIICACVITVCLIKAKNNTVYNSRHEEFALRYFYDRDSNSNELVISDPAVIRELENWDKYGCRYIYSFADSDFTTNDEVMSILHSEENPDEWRLSVINALYVMLAEDEFERSNELAELAYDSKIKMIEQRRSYTLDEINDAMEVFVFGADNVSEDNQYDSITDIPYDLQNACIYAIDESPVTGIELINAWSIAISNR